MLNRHDQEALIASPDGDAPQQGPGLSQTVGRGGWPVGAKVSLREAFGHALCALAEKRDDFVLFDADVNGGTGARPFVERYPERVVQFGIAEQNMMAAAAGFAATGLIPVVTTFSVFATMRAHEQLRTAVAYGQRNVKICASHLGLDVGPDGPTAQMLEDLAITRSIPHVTVVVPADATEMALALEAILDWPGPVYLRIGRSPAPVIFDESHRFEVGRASLLREGEDATVVAAGVMVARALEAARRLAEEGIRVCVVNLSTLKPLDEAVLLQSAERTGAMVTAEDHTLLGGVGSAVAELLVQRFPIPVEMVGVPDRFGASGDPEELAEAFGLTPAGIIDAVHRVLERKRR